MQRLQPHWCPMRFIAIKEIIDEGRQETEKLTDPSEKDVSI